MLRAIQDMRPALQVCQGHTYGTKSDVWALGCILYEMCALQQAWNGSNLLGLVYKSAPAPPKRPRAARALLCLS